VPFPLVGSGAMGKQKASDILGPLVGREQQCVSAAVCLCCSVYHVLLQEKSYKPLVAMPCRKHERCDSGFRLAAGRDPRVANEPARYIHWIAAATHPRNEVRPNRVPGASFVHWGDTPD